MTFVSLASSDQSMKGTGSRARGSTNRSKTIDRAAAKKKKVEAKKRKKARAKSRDLFFFLARCFLLLFAQFNPLPLAPRSPQAATLSPFLPRERVAKVAPVTMREEARGAPGRAKEQAATIGFCFLSSPSSADDAGRERKKKKTSAHWRALLFVFFFFFALCFFFQTYREHGRGADGSGELAGVGEGVLERGQGRGLGRGAVEVVWFVEREEIEGEDRRRRRRFGKEATIDKGKKKTAGCCVAN